MQSWMTTLPKEVKNRKFNEIILPGTHDSGAYFVNFENCPKYIKNNWMKYAYQFKFLPVFKGLIQAFTKTQTWSILEQLKNGIRYFDFRISYFPENKNKFWISHTYYCVPLSTIFKDIIQFLQAYPDEVLMLNFTTDYQTNENFTQDVLRNEFIPFLSNSDHDLESYFISKRNYIPSLTEIVKEFTKRRIFFFYDHRHKIDLTYRFLWDANKWIHGEWYDSSNAEKKLQFLKKQIEIEYKNRNDGFNTINITLTPQNSDIKQFIFDFLIGFPVRNLKKMSQEIQNLFFTEKVLYDKQILQDILTKISIITTDFTDTNIVQTIVHLNTL